MLRKYETLQTSSEGKYEWEKEISCMAEESHTAGKHFPEQGITMSK